MTSVFARVATAWPVRKVSFSSQDWCGQVWHQLLPASGRLDGIFHSYFEGEADGRDELSLPEGGVFEDALPLILRGLDGVPDSRDTLRSLHTSYEAEMNESVLSDALVMAAGNTVSLPVGPCRSK